MNTREAIEFLKCVGRNYYAEVEKADIIKLLEEGEDYRQIYKELKGKIYRKDGIGISAYIDNLEQKYFPKPIKKTMIVEIEGENEDLVKNGFNFLKAFLERDKDGFDCRYKIKEGD